VQRENLFKHLFLLKLFYAKKLVELLDQKPLLVFGRELFDLIFFIIHVGLFELDLGTEFSYFDGEHAFFRLFLVVFFFHVNQYENTGVVDALEARHFKFRLDQLTDHHVAF
jgi:hypothetical protein